MLLPACRTRADFRPTDRQKRAGRFRADKRRGPPRSRRTALDWPATAHAGRARRERTRGTGTSTDRRGHGQASGRAREHRVHGRHQGGGGDAGNERHACKANPAMIDDIGKKHGTEDTSENFSGKKYALAPKAATKFLKASRCYVILGKTRRVLWWLGLLLLSPALILWAEWGANGDDDTIICRVLTFSSSSCMNLTTATEYVRRLTLVLIMGVVCWIAALVIFGVRSYMRSVYPELRDHSSSASHVLVGIISFLVLVMVFPVLVITLLSALMTL